MNVLVVAAHPDDDVIGMGGMMRKHALEGDKIHVIYLTSGESGISNLDKIAAGELRRHEAIEACKVIEVTGGAQFWGLADGDLHYDKEIIRRLSDYIGSRQIDRVYSPHIRDGHSDHANAAYLVQDTRTAGHVAFEWWRYEIWAPLQMFDKVIDITWYLKEKRAAIRAHKSQLSNGFDEAIIALNRYRGIMHGTTYAAEVFET